MGRLWLNNGGLVKTSGSLTLCDSCPCTGTVTHVCTTCLNNAAPDEVEVTFPATSGGTCAYCSSHVGTFVLTYDEAITSHCEWNETWANLAGTPNCATGQTLRLMLLDEFTQLRIRLTTYMLGGGGGVCNFEKVVSTGYNCLTMNETLNLVFPTGCTCLFTGNAVTAVAR